MLYGVLARFPANCCNFSKLKRLDASHQKFEQNYANETACSNWRARKATQQTLRPFSNDLPGLNSRRTDVAARSPLTATLGVEN